MQDKIEQKVQKVQIRTKSSKVNKLDLISGRHTDIQTKNKT